MPGVHVTTTSLDLKTPEQRAVAETWLDSPPSSLLIKAGVSTGLDLSAETTDQTGTAAT